MKRAIAIVTAILAGGPVLAAAQAGQGQSSTPRTLVDVAKAEEARRKGVRKPARVYTNDDLKGDASTAAPSRPATPAVPATPGNTTPGASTQAGTPPAATTEVRDQTYWSGKIATARTALERSRLFAEALQSRINALRTDFVNRDDPAQRAQIERDLNTALAELERVKKEMEAQQKEIAAIEDDARRAGVPSGWLRPGA